MLSLLLLLLYDVVVVVVAVVETEVLDSSVVRLCRALRLVSTAEKH